MIAPERLTSLSREELLALVAELQRQMTALQRQVAELAASNETLRAEIEQLKRSGKRQAAPSSNAMARAGVLSIAITARAAISAMILSFFIVFPPSAVG